MFEEIKNKISKNIIGNDDNIKISLAAVMSYKYWWSINKCKMPIMALKFTLSN